MEVEKVMKQLERQEKEKLKSGFRGDARECAYKRATLYLLNKILHKKVSLDVRSFYMREEKLLKKIEKLERDLDFYIKEYPK